MLRPLGRLGSHMLKGSFRTLPKMSMVKKVALLPCSTLAVRANACWTSVELKSPVIASVQGHDPIL